METSRNSNNAAVVSGFINLIVIIIAFVILYYMFQWLFGTSTMNSVVLQSTQLTANQGLHTYRNQAKLYEGGEYTVNLWIYISGWSYLQGTRKHVFEIGGDDFASLLISLGSYKNSLSVRVDTIDASGSSVNTSGGLSNADKKNIFTPLSLDNSLSVSGACDIDTIDLQRWVQVTVVLNGNTCDVYMDGKLARSCVLASYFRVDTSSQSVRVLDRGGFDGYLSQVSTYNYSLNPSSIYNMYMMGPSPPGLDIWEYLTGLVTFKKPTS